MWWLKMRMYLLLIVLFSIIYAIFSVIGHSLGLGTPYFYIILAVLMMAIQYMIGPKIVEWSMRVKYIKENEYPHLHAIVTELAHVANIPVPRIGIAHIPIPNAFAFGRTLNDGRVCVTEGILRLLSREELRAVLGHEISHLKNRDVLTITILSVIPMVLYSIARHLMFAGYYGRRRERGDYTAIVGLAAFFGYFISNLLVLYASRIREYFADRGSVTLGNQPSWLSSALYKLVYGSARLPKEAIREAEGLKAFFATDPSRALIEIRELSQLDLDKSGTIDSSELEALKTKTIRLSAGDRLLEILTTHPNMLKRIKALSSYTR
jgi:heat shock protein HtpX